MLEFLDVLAKEKPVVTMVQSVFEWVTRSPERVKHLVSDCILLILLPITLLDANVYLVVDSIPFDSPATHPLPAFSESSTSRLAICVLNQYFMLRRYITFGSVPLCASLFPNNEVFA